MTILGTHRGPISGLIHIHLLRESAAVRTRRLAESKKLEVSGAQDSGGGPEATGLETATKGDARCPV
ncbi:MAG: hypothetical protein ABSE58_11710 [Candidatus Limnocylindrales bacterium]|jgi:hypothetical protein